MFDGYREWKEVDDFAASVHGLEVLEKAADGPMEKQAAQAIAGVLNAVSTSSKAEYRAQFEQGASIEVVGLDRDRIAGLGANGSVTEVLFPGGFSVVVVRALFSRNIGFVEFFLKGVVNTTGRLYVTPVVVSFEIGRSGLISRYSEFTDVTSLYDLTA